MRSEPCFAPLDQIGVIGAEGDDLAGSQIGEGVPAVLSSVTGAEHRQCLEVDAGAGVVRDRDGPHVFGRHGPGVTEAEREVHPRRDRDCARTAGSPGGMRGRRHRRSRHCGRAPGFDHRWWAAGTSGERGGRSRTRNRNARRRSGRDPGDARACSGPRLMWLETKATSQPVIAVASSSISRWCTSTRSPSFHVAVRDSCATSSKPHPSHPGRSARRPSSTSTSTDWPVNIVAAGGEVQRGGAEHVGGHPSEVGHGRGYAPSFRTTCWRSAPNTICDAVPACRPIGLGFRPCCWTA